MTETQWERNHQSKSGLGAEVLSLIITQQKRKYVFHT